MADIDWKRRIADREGELNALRSRWKTDEDLLYLKEYKMKRLDGQEEPGERTYNITLNDPATFAARVIAVLMGAYQQELVEGDGLSDRDTTEIETLLRHAEEEAAERLVNRGLWPAYAHAVEQMCMRGRAASRLLVRLKDGKAIIDDTPLDARYVVWQFDSEGLEYIAYKVTRRRSELEAEYPDYDLASTADTAELTDLWTRRHNQIWVNDIDVRNEKHQYGECPGVYTICPAGSMLAGDGSIAHHGEGIFAADRGLWPEMNRAASILQTLNVTSFNQGLQLESDAGAEGALPEKDPRTPWAITAVEKRGGFKLIPVADIRNATRHLLSMLEGRIQRGALPAIDYGNLTFPLSAVAIARLTEGRDQIFVPRIQGLALHQQAKSRLIIRQLKRLGGEIELGAEGHRRTFSVAILNKSFSIKYRYFSEAPEQKIANYAVAEAAKAAGLSDDTIFRDILRLPDPNGEHRKRRAENAERLDPVLSLYRHCHNLIEEGKDVEARLMKTSLLRMLRERGIGKEEESVQAGPPAIQSAPLVPLLSRGESTGARGPNRDVEDISEALQQAEDNNEKQADIMRAAREVEARG